MDEENECSRSDWFCHLLARARVSSDHALISPIAIPRRKTTHLVELPSVVPGEPDEDGSAVLALDDGFDVFLRRGDRRWVCLARRAGPVDGDGGGCGRGREAGGHFALDRLMRRRRRRGGGREREKEAEK